jgi:hypothetical protein
MINNDGTIGPSIRGAIQPGANGGNITDARLSGSGVTAGDFGSLAPGGNSGTLSVTFTASNAGALDGQFVFLINNFDNVRDQLIAVTGSAFRLASATVTPLDIVFANAHVGDTQSMNLTVSNTAANDGFSEELDASFSGTTGNVSASGSINNLAPQGTDNTSMQVALDTSSAGARSGTATVVLASDGTNTSGFAPTALPSQTVNVSGNVYRLASPSAHSPEPVNLGVVHVGETATRALTISNTAANDTFSEKLDAAFGGATGDATASGSIDNLAPQATDNTSLVAGIDTSTIGTKSGTATITLTSDGSDTSMLGTTALTSQTVNIGGQVNFYADPEILFQSGMAMLIKIDETHYTLDFGTLDTMAGVVTASVDIQNFLLDLVFQDTLNGTFDLSGINDFLVTGTQAFSGVGPGGNDPNSPTASFDPNRTVGTYIDQLVLLPTSSNASSTSGIPGIAQIELTLQATVVPEPGTWALMIVGLGFFVAVARRKKPAVTRDGS